MFLFFRFYFWKNIVDEGMRQHPTFINNYYQRHRYHHLPTTMKFFTFLFVAIAAVICTEALAESNLETVTAKVFFDVVRPTLKRTNANCGFIYVNPYYLFGSHYLYMYQISYLSLFIEIGN